jgi:hypothetical protein
MPMEYGNAAQWFAGAATFGAVLVALFKDGFGRWYRGGEVALMTEMLSGGERAHFRVLM